MTKSWQFLVLSSATFNFKVKVGANQSKIRLIVINCEKWTGDQLDLENYEVDLI